jgi:hypothetical protein
MAQVFNRAHSELRRPLGSQSSACRRRLYVEENGPALDLGAENPNRKIVHSALNASN